MDDDAQSLSGLAVGFVFAADQLRDESSIAVDDLAVRPLVLAWANLVEWATRAGLSDDDTQAITFAARDAMEAYGTYKAVHGQNKGKMLSAIRAHLDVFPAVFDELEKSGKSPKNYSVYRALIQKAQEESERLTSVMIYVSDRTSELDRLIAGVREAEESAKRAVGDAQRAATAAATSTLERSFQETASSNAKAAAWFRGFTIGTLALTVLLGGIFAMTHAPSDGAETDWYGIVYRLAVLSGLAAVGRLPRASGGQPPPHRYLGARYRDSAQSLPGLRERDRRPRGAADHVRAVREACP